jgi:hypothetical protein
MGEGFIVRKGGAVTEQALAPTITEVSKTDSEIVFTITNNDASTAVILWEVDDSSPDANSLELATGVTSNNITVDSLADDTTFIVYATANVTGKIKSEVASESITTDETIVYTAATGGTTEEYDDGGKRYKSHTFTSNGTFEVTTVGDATGDRNQVDYLIIAGGGGGQNRGSGSGAGPGGGAGGYRTTFGTQGGLGTLDSKVTVTETSYSVVIGAGGAGGSTDFNTASPSGSNSSAFSISSTGGGGASAFLTASVSGGSGSGAWYIVSGTRNGGAGTANQGFAGGNNTESRTGVGGGGAGEAGANTTEPAPTNGTKGGDGLSSIIRTGSAEFRAGGGGGGAYSSSDTGGVGGNGGGGNGGNGPTSNGSNGTVNTGGGGGGVASASGQSGSGTSSAGGSGIVIIRYEIAPSV